jgi:hypothetical protein
MVFQTGDQHSQMAEIAIVVAVAQSCLEIAQVLCSNGVTAQGAVAVLERAVVDEDEFHMPPPSEKQNTVSGG